MFIGVLYMVHMGFNSTSSADARIKHMRSIGKVSDAIHEHHYIEVISTAQGNE